MRQAESAVWSGRLLSFMIVMNLHRLVSSQMAIGGRVSCLLNFLAEVAMRYSLSGSDFRALL